MPEAAMDVDTFWELIEQAKVQGNSSIERQASIVIEKLAALSENEIVEFDRIYTEFENRAYRADLWDVANIVYGGCGDDSFTDFRGWLIAQGHEIYEGGLANPDSLAGVLETGTSDDGPYESFAYVVLLAYERKMGDNAVMPVSPQNPPRQELIGDFARSIEELRAKYPRIATKFMTD
ncbi:MAG: DUF4240 domain-containing protein [Anaerolineae bacterium]|nr:DUF4240 domain-containing protein [Anaerolineae bacterium]